jgi:hypothetical protein
MTFGEGTMFGGMLGMVASLWPLVEGKLTDALGFFLVSAAAALLGYGITRLEKPPPPPPPS